MPESPFSRNQFTFYRSFYEAVLKVPKKDRLPVLTALIAYGLDGAEPETEGLSDSAKIALIMIRPTLRSGRMKAEARIRKNEENAPEPPEEGQKEAPAPQWKKPGGNMFFDIAEERGLL